LDDILHSFIEKTFFFRVRKTVLCVVVVAYVFQTSVHHGFEYGAKNQCIEMSSITQKLTQNYLFQLKLILGCTLIHQCWSPPTVKTLPPQASVSCSASSQGTENLIVCPCYDNSHSTPLHLMPAPFSEMLANLNSADSYTSFCFPKLNPTTNFEQNWQFFALTKEINCLIYF